MGVDSIKTQNPVFGEFSFSLLEKLFERHKKQFFVRVYRHFTFGEALDILRELGVTTERINSKTQIVHTDSKTFYIVLRFSEFSWHTINGIKATPEDYESSFLLKMNSGEKDLRLNIEDLAIISDVVLEKNNRLKSKRIVKK